jgi:hypothetical protein
MSDKSLDSKKKKLDSINEGNLRSYQEFGEAVMDNFGQQVDMDTGDLRRETLIKHLVITGVWTEEQALDFEIEFHTKVEERLNSEWERLRTAIAEQKKPRLQTVQRPSVILDAQGRPITSG